MSVEAQLLTTSIEQAIGNAREALWTLSEHAPGSVEEADSQEWQEEHTELERPFRHAVEKAFRETSLLAATLGYPDFSKEIIKTLKDIGDLTHISYNFDEPYSPSLSKVTGYFESLKLLTRGRDVSGLGILESILKNAGKIISDSGETPTNESQVRAPLLTILGYCFPDARREIRVVQNIKTYSIDLGVESLMAGVEVKFIDSEANAKKSVDDVYTDIKGYTNDDKWRSFYALFYQTGPYLTQDHVQREFERVGIEKNWTPIVVTGPGGRTKKKPG